MARDFFVHPSAEVEEGAIIGAGTKIWHQVHVRAGARLGEDCVVGKDAYIDQGVVVGSRVKIQNGVSIYQGVTIEDDVLVGPHAAFTNDLFPRAFNQDWQVLPTLVQQGASIGANATVVCGVTIGPYAMVAAGAVVASDVPAHCLVVGNPARIAGRVCRCGHKLRRKETRGEEEVLICTHCGATVTMATRISLVEISVFDRDEPE